MVYMSVRICLNLIIQTSDKFGINGWKFSVTLKHKSVVGGVRPLVVRVKCNLILSVYSQTVFLQGRS